MQGMLILVLVATFFLSLIATCFFKQIALKKALLDIPNDRSSHKIPIPRGAGIVFVSIFYALCFTLWYGQQINPSLFLALLGGIPITILGYLDDLYSISSRWRFLVHVGAAIWFVFCLGVTGFLSALLVIVMTAWLINLYNFMDGIDGLAASEAVFTLIAAAIVLWIMKRDYSVIMLCVGLSGAILGFLYWNWPPAKLFMGDTGSGFLGYCFSVMIFSTASHSNELPVMFWFLLLGVFLTDSTYTLLMRIKQRKPWREAHREHIYQRLVDKGLKHHQVTLGVLGINCFILLPLALYVIQVHSSIQTVLFSIASTGVSLLIWYILYIKVRTRN